MLYSTQIKIIGWVCALLVFASCEGPYKYPASSGEAKKQVVSSSVNLYSWENVGKKLEVRWLSPLVSGVNTTNSLLVMFFNEENQLADLADNLQLEFMATMPSMGNHPLKSPGYFERIDIGLYINKFIEFNMNGKWSMSLELYDRKEKIVERVQWSEEFH